VRIELIAFGRNSCDGDWNPKTSRYGFKLYLQNYFPNTIQ